LNCTFSTTESGKVLTAHSAKEQSLDIQVEQLIEVGCEKIFQESGPPGPQHHRCPEHRRDPLPRAKAKGKHLGRHANFKLHQQIRELAEKGMNKHVISKKLGCSRTMVYRVLS